MTPRISAACTRIVLQLPELAPLIYSLPIREGKLVPGAWAQVDQNYNILISEEAEDRHLPGLILHEVLHVVLQHFDRARKLTPLVIRIFDEAADAVINQIILPLGFSLPPGIDPNEIAEEIGVRPEELVDLGVEEVYYRLLQQRLQNQNQNSPQRRPHDNHEPFYSPQSSASPSSPSPSPQQQQQPPSASLALQNLPNHLNQQSQQSHPASQQQSQQPLPQSDQQPDQQPDQQQVLRPEDLAHFVISVLPSILRRHGLSPAGIIRDWIRNRHGTLDWRSLLYNVFTSLHRQYIFPHRKLLPFHLSFPHQVPAYPNILVAIDASGSISKQELSQFLAEVDALQQQFPSNIHIISFDAVIYPLCEVPPHQPLPPDLQIRGGGGTDFRPIAEYAVSQPHIHYDAVIVLTDGYGEYPSPEHPAFKDTKWVWVLTPNHQRPPAHCGEWAVLEGGER